MTKRCVYLTDMTNSAVVLDLDTREQTTIFPAQVKGAGRIGLRGYVLQYVSGANWEETGEQAELTDELYDELAAAYANPNNWNYDYPNPVMERGVSPEQLAALRATLEGKMAKHAFDFEIVGLQPRFLMYFSDGNANSQKKFLALVPRPGHANPYRHDGTLSSRFRGTWGSIERDAGVSKDSLAYYKRPGLGGLAPLLYSGPAAVVRFLLDGQNPAFEGCRVYVTLDGDFICSDWCQRHDHTTYSAGINLQEGIYDFDSWIVGPCVSRAMAQGVFKPKSCTIKTEAVRELMRRPEAVVTVPTFAEAFKEAAAAYEAERLARVDVMEDRLTRLINASPEADDATIMAQAIEEMKAAYLAGEGNALAGAMLLIPAPQIFLPVPGAASKYLLPGTTDRYRFMARPGTCGAPVAPNRVCVRQPGVNHSHVWIPDTAIDLDATEERMREVLATLRAQYPVTDGAPAVALSEITADVLEEAKRVLALERASRETQLAAQALAHSLQRVEALTGATAAEAVVAASAGTSPAVTASAPASAPASPPDLDAAAAAADATAQALAKLPVVPALCVEHDYTHQFAHTTVDVRLRCMSAPHGGVSLAFTKGPPHWLAEGDRVVRQDETGTLRYVTVTGKSDAAPGDPVNVNSALGRGARWYFDEYLPSQKNAQLKALTAAPTFTINDASFRAFPVVGGMTLVRVVDGAVSSATTVRRKHNGIYYRVLPDGSTALLDDDLRAAAVHFTKVVQPTLASAPAPTTYTAAA